MEMHCNIPNNKRLCTKINFRINFAIIANVLAAFKRIKSQEKPLTDTCKRKSNIFKVFKWQALLTTIFYFKTKFGYLCFLAPGPSHGPRPRPRQFVFACSSFYSKSSFYIGLD